MNKIDQNLLGKAELVDNGKEVMERIQASNIKPIAPEFEELEVTFELSSLVERICDAYADHYEFLVECSDAGGLEVPTGEELKKFFEMVLTLKVDYVSQAHGRAFKYKNARGILAQTYVPDFFGLFLCNIGIVDVQDLEIRLFPKFSTEVTVDFDLVKEVSKKLRRLRVSEICPNVHVVPLTTTGTLSVMTMLHVEDTLYSNDNTIHPVQVLMGAVFKSVVNEYIHDQMWRVSYGGYESIFRVLSDNIIQGRL